MDIVMWQVIGGAFGGAALGAIITGIVSIYLNGKNYRRDYYKKIIDKRLILFFNSSNFLNFNFRQHNFPLLLLQKSV